MPDTGPFPLASDFGMDHLHANYDSETGYYHYTAADSDSGARYSWDTDGQGNYIDGSGHATYQDESGTNQH